jgi:hypothetical protein
MRVFYAVEDALSAALVRRIAAHAIGGDVDLRPLGPQRGNSHLRSNLRKYCQLAQMYPVILVTDLDGGFCAPKLVNEWLDQLVVPSTLIFRVAVREAESWVMADRSGFSSFLGVSPTKIAAEPEILPDPKAVLLHIARQAKRKVREMIVPEPNSNASIGREYNDALCDFVQTSWNIIAASESSPSLRRAIVRIQSTLG